MNRVEQELARIASETRATTGLSAIHIESGESVSLNGSEPFVMASTYKVAIAVRMLNLVNQGEASLDELIDIKAEDFSPGSGVLTRFLGEGGLQVSIRNLLSVMLRLSDNTASHLILRCAGGPESVTTYLRAKGIVDLRVDRSSKEILSDYAGVRGALADAQWSIEQFRTLARAVNQPARRAAQDALMADPRDTCTPAAMASLLAMIQRGEIVSEQSRDLLLAMLSRCKTGPARLKGMLPPKTFAAHKTGTLGANRANVINDVGIIRLPKDRGHVAIAVFIQGQRRPRALYERVIAQLGRCIYDYFTLIK